MQAAFPGGRDLPDGSARSGKGALILTRSAEMPSKASRQTQGTPQQPEYSRDGRPLLLAFRTPPLATRTPSLRPGAHIKTRRAAVQTDKDAKSGRQH